MVRFLIFAAALLMAAPALIRPVAAQDDAARETGRQSVQQLWDLLHMIDILPIMQAEAEVQSQQIALTMFGEPRPGYARQVSEIHDPARVAPMLLQGFSQAVADTPPDLVQAAIAYLETPFGQRVVQLEMDARRVLIDPDADEAARADFHRAWRNGAPRAAMIREMLDGADLVEPNVAAALNATLTFSRGFDIAGGNQVPLNESQMMADIWAQEGEFRIETTDWLLGFMMYAYSPLSDDELRDYTAFSASPEGLALTRLLFSAFEPVIEMTSRQMGQAAAVQMQGRSL